MPARDSRQGVASRSHQLSLAALRGPRAATRASAGTSPGAAGAGDVSSIRRRGSLLGVQSLYRRPLPAEIAPFASPAGRVLFDVQSRAVGVLPAQRFGRPALAARGTGTIHLPR